METKPFEGRLVLWQVNYFERQLVKVLESVCRGRYDPDTGKPTYCETCETLLTEDWAAVKDLIRRLQDERIELQPTRIVNDCGHDT